MKTFRNYTWGTSRIANLGFVEETCWEGKRRVYRKEFEMAANLVPAFVEARRRVIAMEMADAGNPYTEDESGGVQ